MGFSRVEDTHFPKNRYIRVQDKLMDLTFPKVMGILNLTPDSFFADSRKQNDTELLNEVERMINDGADFIDIGGYSTRPNAENVSEKDEIQRILEPLQKIRKAFPTIPISLDTFRGKVAEIGFNEGVDIINDISGFQYDNAMLPTLEKIKLPYILMHVKAEQKNMHKTEENELIFREMIHYFSQKIHVLNERGVTDIIIDPGFGFSKTLDQNYQLLDQLDLFHLLDRPILVGFSRKSMIYKKLNCTPEEALNGTSILNTRALLKGASILRVHDVKAAKEVINLTH
jgi:dihydropteroate synthase